MLPMLPLKYTSGGTTTLSVECLMLKVERCAFAPAGAVDGHDFPSSVRFLRLKPDPHPAQTDDCQGIVRALSGHEKRENPWYYWFVSDVSDVSAKIPLGGGRK